jgi:hypothetical protein
MTQNSKVFPRAGILNNFTFLDSISALKNSLVCSCGLIIENTENKKNPIRNTSTRQQKLSSASHLNSTHSC